MTNFEEFFNGTLNRLSVFSEYSFNMLVGMERVPSTGIDTMGVRVKNGRITLVYNPEFFMSLEEGERTYVLIHEMMHVLLHHCTHRGSGDICRAYKENVAMDLAVNSMIAEGPGIKVPRFKDDCGDKKKGEVMVLLPSMFGFLPLQSFEQYLEFLDKKYPDKTIKFCVGNGSGNGQGKSNGGNNNSSGGSASNVGSGPQGNGSKNVDGSFEISEDCPLGEITKDRMDKKHGEGFDEDAFIDDYVRNVVEQIERNHGWGNLPANAVEMIKKAQEQPLNWGDILRLRLGPFLSYQKEQSRRRWSKHYGKPFLGTTTKCVEPVAVYVDTSGSVGSADLSRFIVEIERIAYYTGVYLWSFDTTVYDPDELVLFTRRTIDSIEFKGRGGTYFSPVFEHAKQKGFSQVVVLTDGFAESIAPAQTEGMEVVWVLTKGGNHDGKPGTVIEMDR